MATRLTELTEPRIILCEGFNDRAFFRFLLQARAIDGFQVVCPNDVVGEGGWTRIGATLSGLFAVRGFENVRTVLIAVDTDEDLAASLARTQEQIRLAEPFGSPSRTLPVPLAPLALVGANPSVSIMFVPWHTALGGLENLCWGVARTTNPALAVCVDNFVVCANAQAWQPSHLGKLQLRSFIAGSYQRNPELSLTFLWDNAAYMVPLNDARFDQIAHHLQHVRATT